MAELVGEAFIRITADTDAMRKALGRQMKSSGKDDAGQYIRSFSQEVEATADKRMAKARKALAKGLVDPKEFDKQVKAFDSIEHAAESWRKALRALSRQHKIATGDFQHFKKAINDWEASAISVRVATERTTRAQAAAREEAAKTVDSVKKVTAANKDQFNLFRSMENFRKKHTPKIGKAFGKGMRNDFFNLTGSLVGGLASLISGAIKIPLKALEMFTDGFQKASVEGATFFARMGSGFTSMIGPLASLATSWPLLLGAVIGTGIALAGVAAILPGIVSLLGLAATAVAALAGAITYGLTAAALAAAPVLAGMAAGLGGLGLAFYGFFADKKNKKFVDDWKKQFTGFGDEFSGEIKTFLTSTATGFKTLFEDITPSVTAFFDSWKKNMQDASTKKGLGAISDSIGRIATTFTSSLPNLLSGLVGFFEPILPYAERLATAIGDAFKRFDDWANSVGGQKAISDFMKEAWKDAKLVWEILKDVGSIIGSVFDFGSEEGTGFLEGIHGWLKKIADYLKDPKNKGKIEEWFANAEQVGKDIGGIVTDVGDLIGYLSSEQGQTDAKQFMDTMGTLAGHAKTFADALTVISATSGLGVAADFFTGTEATETEPAMPSGKDKYNQWSKDVNDAITTGLNTAWENTKTWTTDMGETIGTFFTELPGKVSTWFDETVTSLKEGFRDGGITIMDGVAGWLDDFATSIEEFDLGAWMTGVAEDVGTFFVQLGMQIGAGLTNARLAIGQWITDTWNEFTTWGSGVGQRVGTGLSSIPGAVMTWLTTARASIGQWVSDTLADFQRWASGLPARIQQGITRVGAMLAALPGQVGAWLASVPERLAAPFRQAWDRVNTIFAGAPGRLAAAAGRVINAIGGALSGVWSAITSPFRTAWAEVQRIVRQIGNIRIPTPKMPSIDLTPWNAAGNIYNGPTVIGVGEAGPEAVVPLDRPLAMVNPSVRGMSAVLQQMTGGRGAASSGNIGAKVNFAEGAINVNLPTGDPSLAAEAVLDRLVAYIH